jgi:hypothetical protein
MRPAAFFASRQSSCWGGASAVWLRSSPNTGWSPAGFTESFAPPSYLGLFVLTLGWGLAFRSGVGVVIAVMSLGVLLARIQAEERLLSATFGTEYDAYRARTWRLVPCIY